MVLNFEPEFLKMRQKFFDLSDDITARCKKEEMTKIGIVFKYLNPNLVNSTLST